MTVTTARDMSEDQRVGLDEVPPAGLRLRLEQAVQAGNREQAPAILVAVGPGSS
jgi:hypothetical protein